MATGQALRAGDFRHVATLQSPTVTLDTHGGRSTTWSGTDLIRCKVEATGGDETMQGSQPSARRTNMVTTWYRTDIDTSKRLVIGSRTLEIVSVSDPSGLGRVLQLTCVEVV